MDYLPLPKHQVFNINDLRIGVHHGDGVYPRGDPKGLTQIADSLSVNILISGHTHVPFIKHGLREEILLINPGSLTGVWGGGGGSMKPSMMIIELNDKITIQHYELIDTRLKVNKYTIRYMDNKWIF